MNKMGNRQYKWGGGSLMVVLASFAALGYLLLAMTQAATSAVSAEPEDGVVARARTGVDNEASGGRFITFPGTLKYVAIGDSVASGEGIEYGWKWVPSGSGGSWVRTGPANPVWEPAADTRPEVQACHRSKMAYPAIVATATKNTSLNLSCTGSSVINGVLGRRVFSETLSGAAQVGYSKPGQAPPSPEYDAFKPDVVTITLGMDDIRFSEVLRWCFIGDTCVTTENDAEVNRRLGIFKNNLKVLLSEINTRGTSAGHVPAAVLTTYYDPFSPNPQVTCADIDIGLGNGIGPEEITWLRSKTNILNQYIKDAAASYPKSKVVDINKVLAGHELCSADPWVYGLSIWYSDYGNPAPFHPTPKGQQAIANQIIPVMESL